MHLLKFKTPNARAKAFAHQRRQGSVTGSYISDLAALGKAIMLCPSCAPKFDAKRHGYQTSRQMPVVRGNCDGCRRFDPRLSLFLKGS